jgi:hypothetical protein
MDITLNLTVHSFKEKQPEKHGWYLVWFYTDWVEVVYYSWNNTWGILESALYTQEDFKKALYWALLPTMEKGR